MRGYHHSHETFYKMIPPPLMNWWQSIIKFLEVIIFMATTNTRDLGHHSKVTQQVVNMPCCIFGLMCGEDCF